MTPNKQKEPEFTRVTLRLPRGLWDAVQHRAIDERTTATALVEKALGQLMGRRS